MCIFIFLMECASVTSISPIDKAARSVEQLLGPYTSEEHVKCGLVLWEPRLNNVYVDPTIRLAECPDPDNGRRKWARVPMECNIMQPIIARPLYSVGSGGTGGLSCARVDAAERSTKWVAQGTP